MKRTRCLPLGFLLALAALPVGLQAQATTDTQNVHVEYGPLEIVSIDPEFSSAKHLSVGAEFFGSNPGHVTLIPESGSTAALLAAGALGVVAWLRRRIR